MEPPPHAALAERFRQDPGRARVVVRVETELREGMHCRTTARGHVTEADEPRSVGGTNTQMLAIFVDDADAHCARARAAGGKIHEEPTTSDYGDDYWSDRTYRVEDPEGHHWWFMQRLRSGAPRGR